MTEGLLSFIRQKKTDLIVTAVLLPVVIVLMWNYDEILVKWLRQITSENSTLIQLYANIRPIVKAMTDGVTVALVGVAIYIHGRLKKNHLQQTGKLMIAGFITAGISAQFIKHMIGRARPRISDETLFIGPNFHIDFDSFPSGHTAVAFAVAYILSRLYPKLTFAFYAFAALTAFDRLIGISHFVSDILAAIVLGTLIGRFIFDKMSSPERQTSNKN